MDNKRKLWLIRIFLFSKILFHIALFIAVLWGAAVVKDNQRWVEHTNSVINEIEIVKNEFRTADYTARNRNLSGRAYDLTALRKEALDGIERLQSIVSDNPTQVENLNQLSSAIRARFESQDEQFQSLMRSEHTISYPIESIAKATNSMESVESLFSAIQMHEINLLRLERAPKAFQSQWMAIYLLCSVSILSFIITVYLNIMLQRNLVVSMLVGARLQGFKDEHRKEDENFVRVPKSLFAEWQKTLQGG